MNTKMNINDLVNEFAPSKVDFENEDDVDMLCNDLQIDHEQKYQIIYAMCMFLDTNGLVEDFRDFLIKVKEIKERNKRKDVNTEKHVQNIINILK